MEKVHRRLKQYLEKVMYPPCSPHCYVCSHSCLLRVCRAETRRGSGSSSKYMQCSRTLDDESDTTWARTNVGKTIPTWQAWATHWVLRTRLRLRKTRLRRSIIVVEYSAKAEVETFPLGDDAKAILAFERSIAFPDTAALFFCLYSMPLTLQSSSLYFYAVQRTENLKVRMIGLVSEYRDSDNIISI